MGESQLGEAESACNREVRTEVRRIFLRLRRKVGDWGKACARVITSFRWSARTQHFPRAHKTFTPTNLKRRENAHCEG